MGVHIGNSERKLIIGNTSLDVLQPNFTNMVPTSINPDGTIYNGVGYKNGYRVRSGGAETSAANTTCTGFIPVNGGDVVRVYGWDRYKDDGSSQNAINVADSSFTNIGQVSNYRYGIFETGDYTDYDEETIIDYQLFSEWVLPPAESGVAYIRVSAYDHANGCPSNKLIVTINEEIQL